VCHDVCGVCVEDLQEGHAVRGRPTHVEGERDGGGDSTHTVRTYHTTIDCSNLKNAPFCQFVTLTIPGGIVKNKLSNRLGKESKNLVFLSNMCSIFQHASNIAWIDHKTHCWLSKGEGTLILRSSGCFGDCKWKNERCRSHGAGGLPGKKVDFMTRCGVIIGSARMECTCHTVLFRKYRWVTEHPSFYALTSLFPSISRYKRSHTRLHMTGCMTFFCTGTSLSWSVSYLYLIPWLRAPARMLGTFWGLNPLWFRGFQSTTIRTKMKYTRTNIYEINNFRSEIHINYSSLRPRPTGSRRLDKRGSR